MLNNELIELLTDLCAQPQETQWLEFKLNGATKNAEIGEYISALSNGATLANKPYGYLVWGVENATHNIVGTKFSFSKTKQGNQDLELWLRTLLSPKLSFEVFEFEYQAKRIVLMRIPSAQGEPTCFKNEPYVRVGSNVTKLNKYPDMMRSVYNSREDWSKKIIKDASLQNLDATAVRVAREKFKERHSDLSVTEWDDITFLNKAGVTIDGKITNTALLLLGKPESVHYLSPAVAQITWKLNIKEEQAYEHFAPPFLLTTEKVKQRIRNVKHHFFPTHELLATVVDKYNPQTILEALHNCIAHQDYSLRSRIIVTEEADKLTFENAGMFFEGRPEEYFLGQKTPHTYRNNWLAKAMHNLGMIDEMGLGINRMCKSQRDRYFPLPEYDLSPQKVILQIYGKVIDENYSNLLIQRSDLTLDQILVLDRVQKKQPIPDAAAANLRKNKLLEGRKPKYFVSTKIAQTIGQKAEYTKHKGLDEQYYLDLILKSLEQHGSLNRQDIDKLLWNKLSDLLTDSQRRKKIDNLLTKLRKNKQIKNMETRRHPKWVVYS
ncbi:divergent AAA domain protein [Candidatus Termititenax aidoneus]|uniref:Divergent AAA domain protein n=1 Tax=Termititenax aidoneus TaxID=2218524 RepID=A0A388TCB6_TERA1|nr:divergent AAA domain protein [Candidatus Termititenax aidoneus]